MKTKFTWVGIVTTILVSICTFFIACKKDDVNAVVQYNGRVVYINTTTPFSDLSVKVTDGQNTHCQTKTDASGEFTLTVRINEINGNYYLLVGDATCVPVKKALSGYGQDKVDLGTIEVEGPTLPTVTTNPISNVSDNKATLGGKVTFGGRLEVIARGVCWAKTKNPTINDNYTNDGTGEGEFSSQITDLEAGELYYVRAYATNKKGTAYGEELSLTTITGLPTVTTSAVSSITATTATCEGNVAAGSGYTITARGVCWSCSTATPSVGDSHTSEIGSTGSFTSMIIGLERNTTYYVRAYATNQKGTGYGETKKFTTLNGLPTVTTSAVTEIKASSAKAGGNVTSNGGYTITARGVCWSSSTSTPTPEDSHTNEVADNGTFTSLMTNLETNTTYYVRAYATNEVGTAFGESIVFTTSNGIPTVETIDPGENITASSIGAVGNITDDGGYEVTERGFVYGTLPYPTLENGNKISAGNGTGYYSATITGITPTKYSYYIRAYATNSKGTAYGNQITITPERSDYLSLMTMSFGGYIYRIKFIGALSWTDGKTSCENMVFGGFTDWFMPNIAEVQAIIQAYGLWNKTSSYSNNSTLRINGCESLWTSQEYSSYEYYYYYLRDTGGSGYLWSWTQSSNGSGKSAVRGVFAVRKYRAE